MTKTSIERDQYGVFGNPIEHSKSPVIHHFFAELTQQPIQYSKFLGDLDSFEQQVKTFFEQGGKGLNVTVPFKERAFQLCDVLSSRAQQAGAVNTLLIGKNGDIFGDTTDGVGMIRDICDNHSQSLTDKRVLVLGAGGAVRGILEPLRDAGPSTIVVANRTLSKAQALADHFHKQTTPITASAFETLEGHFDVIINGTSASLDGDLPPLPDSVIKTGTWCYDMMYGKEPTVFLKWAQTLGANGSDGLGMLVEQAAESFYLWRMQRPDTCLLIQKMRDDLS
ncbi:shikimate dehydrogenase [Marinomonas sp. 15G1-11]|uniref:Shikimate dehydrogenase (NADP(+)) n=1 Tax=Marinomonas phaeophyticola TaxID=3004091 RepID=A0ABT4JU23_9GAMM|nr:shikimate dehydrogenase [Marinomonas sp. 15G1-11]MCZ2721867.1 shikimate dehydrogenase [Marinomonas sp. 15G1-11]